MPIRSVFFYVDRWTELSEKEWLLPDQYSMIFNQETNEIKSAMSSRWSQTTIGQGLKRSFDVPDYGPCAQVQWTPRGSLELNSRWLSLSCGSDRVTGLDEFVLCGGLSKIDSK
jgi:hypothetical protein